MGPRSVLFALQELLVLLPHVALELQFVGDSLPPESDQQNFTLQRVRAEGGALLFSPNPPAVLPAGLCPSDPCLLSPSYLMHLPVPKLPLASPPHSKLPRMTSKYLSVLVPGYQHG